jgi:hypothetical protein
MVTRYSGNWHRACHRGDYRRNPGAHVARASYDATAGQVELVGARAFTGSLAARGAEREREPERAAVCGSFARAGNCAGLT